MKILKQGLALEGLALEGLANEDPDMAASQGANHPLYVATGR